MKIKFNGMKVSASNHSGGCPVCGRNRVTKESFISVKTFILPSGITKTFRAGNKYDVSEQDGKFLLQYPSFVKVN